MSTHQKESTIAEQASRWLIELEGQPTPGALADFASWLKASPCHIKEFLASAAVWSQFNGLDREHRIDVRSIAMTAGTNVVPHRAGDASAVSVSTRARRHWRWAAVLAGVAVIAASTWLGRQRLHVPVYTYMTSVGEQRSIKLTDGSVVQLNTATRIEARLDGDVREVHLIGGEALFTVARDVVRPFRVRSGETVIQALGTQFNVHRRAEGTQVSVIEGAVKIRVASEESKLDAGEEAIIDARGNIDTRQAPDIAKTVAWRERRLVFRENSLAEIVSEFNRYNAGYQIRLMGEPGKDMRLTGVFKADDPQAIVLYLQQNSDLIIHKGASDGEILIEAAHER